MMKNIVVIGAVVLLSAPAAMAKERSLGVCAADIKAKCEETLKLLADWNEVINSTNY